MQVRVRLNNNFVFAKTSAEVNMYVCKCNKQVCITNVNCTYVLKIFIYLNIKTYLLTSPNTYFKLITIKILDIIEEVFVEIMGNNRFQNHFENYKPDQLVIKNLKCVKKIQFLLRPRGHTQYLLVNFFLINFTICFYFKIPALED